VQIFLFTYHQSNVFEELGRVMQLRQRRLLL
jgi:hypothetical protein